MLQTTSVQADKLKCWQAASGHEKVLCGEVRLRCQVYSKPPQSCFIAGRWNVSHVGFAVAQLCEPLERKLSGWICGRADAERDQRLLKIEA
jgi:hypothetical protein